jgi:hypothetical protein
MKFKLKNSRPLIIAIAVPLSFVLLLASTFAWFQAKDSVNNLLKMDQYQFNLPGVDVFTPPGSPIRPGGNAVDKRVAATNTGDMPGFVRILVLPTITGADDVSVLPARIGSEVSLEPQNNDWADGGDGYYYYLKVLGPGETSSDLFRSVKLAANLAESYLDAKLKIEIKSESTDTMKWNYRIGWWGADTPPSSPALKTVDTTLQSLAS